MATGVIAGLMAFLPLSRLTTSSSAAQVSSQRSGRNSRQESGQEAVSVTAQMLTARVAQRLLALTAAIWHNRATGQPVTRSLVAYDHQSPSDLLV